VQADHFKLIREIGAASTVLLKNTGNALPLRVKNLKRGFLSLIRFG
jgi:beta-glucosidase